MEQYSNLPTAFPRNSVSVCIRNVLNSNIQSPTMPRTSKNSTHGNDHLSKEDTEVPSSQEELRSSDQESDPEVSFHLSRAPQAIPNMFMPYIEGPDVDWTVNDALYHRFLKWCLKCENILECEPAALSE